MHAWRFVAFFLLCSTFLRGQGQFPTPNWEAAEKARCGESQKTISLSVGQYEVRLVPVPQTEKADRACRAYLVDQAGTKTLVLEDWDVFVDQATGEDVFGNSHPGLILEGFSGGAHCCYTYKIIDLAAPPVVLGPIENDSPFFFFKDATSGQFRIMTTDGAFDYFDGSCHACSPFPTVILRVQAQQLVNASGEFVHGYDTEIAEARRKINPDELGEFLTVHNLGANESAKTDFMKTRQHVLEIVLAYLYSGREGQAWETLEEMWPAGDRLRIKKLILSMRSQGLLSQLRRTAAR